MSQARMSFGDMQRMRLETGGGDKHDLSSIGRLEKGHDE
jgi:hypothetical protein